MNSFELYGVPRILFGRGQSKRLGEIAAALGRSAFIIHSGPAIPDSILQSLAADGVKTILRRQRGEPVVSDIDQSVEHAKGQKCDLLIAIGGGSAIDAAKATAALLTNGGSAIDYMEVVGKGQKITKPAAPWIAIPTTAGTGAEATRNAVIGLPEKKFKASIRSEHLLPRLAIIDPDLGQSVPPSVIASSGMDALCQLIESYTSTGATPFTDALALQAIPQAARSLPKAYLDPQNSTAREEMSLAALFSGIALTHAGLGAVHGFAAPLGANFPIPHGTICAALLSHIIQANVQALRGSSHNAALARYATIGRKLADDDRLSDQDAIVTAIQFTADLAKQLNIPPLKNFGLTADHVPAMVDLAKKASSMRYNPIALSDQALCSALNAAIAGHKSD